jgi:hypothetical protein
MRHSSLVYEPTNGECAASFREGGLKKLLESPSSPLEVPYRQLERIDSESGLAYHDSRFREELNMSLWLSAEVRLLKEAVAVRQ